MNGLARWSLAVALILLVGCSGGEAPVDPPAASPQNAPGAKTLPIPGLAGESAPADTGPSTRLEWTVPEGWVEETPSSQMRLAQYRVPGAGGDGSCLVFYFGPGQGGDVMGNAHRWAGQFSQPDGQASTEVMTISPLEPAPLPTRIVELTGTYEGGMTMTDAPSPAQPDYMLLGAIVDGPDAPWFFKFTGPEATLREQRQAFLDLIASIHTHG